MPAGDSGEMSFCKGSQRGTAVRDTVDTFRRGDLDGHCRLRSSAVVNTVDFPESENPIQQVPDCVGKNSGAKRQERRGEGAPRTRRDLTDALALAEKSKNVTIASQNDEVASRGSRSLPR